MKRIFLRILLCFLIGIFIAGGINAISIRIGRDVFWNSDLIPETTESVSLGSGSKRILKAWLTNLDVSGTFTLGGIVGTGGIDLNAEQLILDADGDMYMQAANDDRLGIIGGSVGIGTIPNVGHNMHTVMSATDIMGLYINGSANPYSGASITHAIGAERTWDYGTGDISQAMIMNTFETYLDSENAKLPADRSLISQENTLTIDGIVSNETATTKTLWVFPFQLTVDNNGTFDSISTGTMNVANRGVYSVIQEDSTFTDTSGTGVTNSSKNMAFYASIIANSTVNSGNLVTTNTGLWVRILTTPTDNSSGWLASINYGVYLDAVTGATTNWGIYDNTTANSCLHALRVGSEVAPNNALDVTGAATIGDGGTTNYLQIAADGELTLVGTARVIKEIELRAAELHPPTVGNPSLSEIGVFSVALFDATSDESLYTQFHLPRDYVDGTDLTVHFHWAPTTADAGNVTWGIEWKAVTDDSNEVLSGAGTVEIIIDATQTLQDEMLGTGSITISGTGIVRKDIIGMRVFRDADASEAGASDTYASDAALSTIAIEYTSDRLGQAL